MQRRRGFTLIEMLLALALGLALIVLASGVYANLQRIATRSLGLQQQWLQKNFLRQQFDAADPDLSRQYAAIKSEPYAFSFITRHSAQYGPNHRPVLVTYRYDASARAIRYHEIAVPPAWAGTINALRTQLPLWRQSSAGYEATLFTNAQSWQMDFWQPASKTWSPQWSEQAILPSLIRWRWQHAGQPQELMLGQGVLSLSFASGS